ncbi:hypothetical protein MRX96_012494 [Rhipicephalus microplus]
MADSMGNPAHSLSLGNRSLTTPPAKRAWHASTSQNGSNHAGSALAPDRLRRWFPKSGPSIYRRKLFHPAEEVSHVETRLADRYRFAPRRDTSVHATVDGSWAHDTNNNTTYGSASR